MIRTIRQHILLQVILLLLSYYLLVGFGEILIPRLFQMIFGDYSKLHTWIDFTINVLSGVVLVLLYRPFTRQSVRSMFIKGGELQFLKGSLVGLLAVSALVGTLYFLGHVNFIRLQWSPLILVSLLYFLSVSWLEEVLTRGVLQHAISPKSVPQSILGVSLFFGALHLANPGQQLLALINTALIAIWLGSSPGSKVTFVLLWAFTLLGMPVWLFSTACWSVDLHLKSRCS